MTATIIQTSFSAGEISPELYGEVHLEKASAAATTLRNAVVNYRGGAMSRGGTAFVGRCKQSVTGTGPPRVIPFQFSNNQGYALEFGDDYLRFVFQGGYVVETGVAITGASQANPCVISVSGTPYSNGDWVFISGVVGMTQLNGNTYIVANVASGHFSLEDLNGNAVDSTAFTAWSSGGHCYRIYTLSTPYAAEDLPYLKFSQTADVMSLTCSNPVTGNEYAPYELTRAAAVSWTLAPSDFDPVIAAPGSVAAVSNALAPSSGVNASFAYVVTAVDAKGNESIASAIATCHGANLQVEAGTNTVTWAAVQGAQFYNVYRAPPSVDNGTTRIPVPAGSIFGIVGSAYGTQLADNNPAPDLTQVPPTHQNPFSQGAILGVTVTSPGSGLTALTYAITTAAGINFSGIPLLVAGSLGGFIIENGGELFQPGDTMAINGAGFASGAVEFGSTNPSANDTITLNGVVWTFVSSVTAPQQTLIGSALAATLAQLVADLSASANTSLTVASYAEDAGAANLLITYKTPGTAGNAYTLAASRASVSGGTLAGGSGSGSAGAKASGTMTFAGGNPTNGQNIVLDGVTWTFVTSGATGTQTNIQGSANATVAQLATDLTASMNASILLATYSAATDVLTITYKTVGTVGNGYTLGAGSAGPTLSASTLTGGANAAATPSVSLVIGPESGTYPGVVAYFQQRRFFANSLNNPDTTWASQTGLYSNMDYSIPTEATDAITASPWTEQVNGIQWLIPMPGGLIAMTGLRAWQIIGQGSYQLNVQPVTPSTIQAQPQAFNGCSATIPPIVIDYDVIYVQAIGDTTVFDLSWNFWVNIYTGNDLTILSSHLFLYRQILQWGWARQPYKVLWACCNDGTMLSLTYLKEQQVYGWARHDTQGLVVSVTTITEPPINALYAIVQRFPPYAPAGIYVMERMDGRIWQSVEDAWCVDSAVSNPMPMPDAALVASSLSGAVTFTASAAVFSAGDVGQVIRMGGGIATVEAYSSTTEVTGTWVLAPSAGPVPGIVYAAPQFWTISAPVTTLNAPHLAGMQVVGLADGVPIGISSTITVGASGLITLPFAASDVKVGLGFTVQIQTPYLNGPEVVQGARKAIPAATARIEATGSGYQYGTNQPDGAAQNPPQLAPLWSGLNTGDTTQPTGGQPPASTYLSPAGETVTQLYTGDLRIVGGGDEWNSRGQVAIQQTLPLPLGVLAVMPEVLPGDLAEVQGRQRQAAGSPAEAAPPQGGGPPQGPGAWMLQRGGGMRL